MRLTQEEQDKIKDYGKQCRELADKGRKLNQGEASLFHNSLVFKDFDQCERLIKTLKERKP